jgi:hypothetical protein
MSRFRLRHACAALLLVAAALPVRAAGAAFHPRYRVRAALHDRAPQVDGTVEVTFTNDSPRPLDEAVVFLFPNRFARPDAAVDDTNRQFVYPKLDFEPGSMEILDAEDDGAPARVLPMSAPGVPDGTLTRVPIAPLAPGASRRLTLRFRTVVPEHFGTFGRFDGQLTLVGGWHPYLAALGDDGEWQAQAPPPLADFDVEVAADAPREVVLNGRWMRAGSEPAGAAVASVHYLSLIAARRFLRSEIDAGGTRVVYYERPRAWSVRISAEPDLRRLLLETAREAVVERPVQAPAPPAEIEIVQAPLRLNLTAPGEGAVVVSDRLLEVSWLLRPFHDRQLAQAIYAELLRPVLAPREPPGDYEWVSEGLSRVLADRFFARARPGTRSVRDWIGLFDVFAIVDRFENAPKIPFAGAFFRRARSEDPLHARVTTFNRDLPPGRVILGKLRQVVGDRAFDALIARCIGADVPFRRCASERQDVAWVFDQWVAPYPSINYRFGEVELNQPVGGRFRHTATVLREASRPIVEPVTVRLRSIGGRQVDVRWNGRGDSGRVSVETPARMCQAIIDPERRLIEDRRDDDARPPTPQVVLDTAEVEVSSTEFGISGLVVGRARYDYRKDLAAAGFFTNRGLGFTAGGRLHWGKPIDPTSYRHNVYGFYGFEALDSGFDDKSRPGRHTSGRLAWLGLRYEYTNQLSFENPTEERQLRLFADWHDRSLGSDFDYADWGFGAVATQPLWSYRSIGAVEVLNGFSRPIGSSLVPNQGLFSLGGSRSIRGIGAEEELGRNIFLVRTELRRDIFPELDFNFLDLLILRRHQLRLFADSGRVDDAAGQVYDVARWALGVGVGLGAVYDFMGFFPSIAYVEIATRLDQPDQAGDVQFLFGTRQSF